jgi:nicotinamide-nucleotide adenylyltransferase
MIGLFIGRFQPFHLGHLHIVKEAAKDVDKLIIGIAVNEKNNENPFSFNERKEMIDSTLKNKNYLIEEIPDFESDEKWVEHVKKNIPKFDIVFMSDKNTDGERWVERCLKEHKIKKIKSLNGVDATTIRKEMRNGREWKQFVPKEIHCQVNALMQRSDFKF